MGKTRDVRYGKEQVLAGRPAPSAERIAASEARFATAGRLLLAALALGAGIGLFLGTPWGDVDYYSGGWHVVAAAVGMVLAFVVQLLNLFALRLARRLRFSGPEQRGALTVLPTVAVLGLTAPFATAADGFRDVLLGLLLCATAALLTWAGAWFLGPWCLAPLLADDARVSAAAATPH